MANGSREYNDKKMASFVKCCKEANERIFAFCIWRVLIK